MNNLQKIFDKVSDLSYEISDIIRESTYEEYDDLSGLKIDYKDAEQLFMLDELQGIVLKLSEVKDKVDYLNKPIKYIGTLHKNNTEKYETEKGDVFSCGRTIEALIYDAGYDVPCWTRTRVEHDGKNYYLVGSKQTSLDGLKVRVR